MTRRRSLRAVLVALALVATAAACGSSSDDRASSTTTAPPRPSVAELATGDATFYAFTEPYPAGTHGDLVKVQPTTVQPDGYTRSRVAYLSTTTQDQPTIVTGTVWIPTGSPPDGGWPLITYARGSTGIADDCAMSMAVDSEDPRLAAEGALLQQAAAGKGIALAVTDYEGLGGPGIHPFLVGESEGRSVLDIARAARQLPGVTVSDQVGIMGYSQGGHAAIWANQLATAWTPELHAVGTVAGASASEVLALAGEDGVLSSAGGVEIVAAMATADPTLDVDAVLTPAGRTVLDLIEAHCQPDPADVPEGPYLTVDPSVDEPWRSALEANVAGNAPGASAVLMFQGTADQSVPPAHATILRDRLCANGTPATIRTIDGADHIAGAVTTVNDGVPWLETQFAGEPPGFSC